MAPPLQLLRFRPRPRVLGVLRRTVRQPADLEEARYQAVHIQIWFGTTVACLLGFVTSLVVRGPTRFALLWITFALCTGTASLTVAHWPRLRGAVSAAIYSLVVVFSTFVLLSADAPVNHGLGYPGLLAVLMGATVAEAPRRALWMGGVCIALSIVRALQQPPGSQSLVTETGPIITATIALVFCGLMAATLWRRALTELNQRAHENVELTTELRRTEQELEARVATRTEELTRRSAELESRTQQLRRSLQEQQRLRRDLAEQTMRDELTGLNNRRYFMETLERLTGAAGGFSLLLIDVDHFKTVNDTYGHHVGDEALVALGTELAGAVRTDDVVARIGGEEFGVILADTPPWQAAHVAETLRARVEECCRPRSIPGLRLTISVGLTGVAAGEQVAPSRLMTRADRALYRAKAMGRNRVAEDEPFEAAPRLGAAW